MKQVGVDQVGDFFQLGQLPVADNTQQHLFAVPAIAALTVQDGHAAVQLGENGFPDLVRMLTDDLDLGTGGTEN